MEIRTDKPIARGVSNLMYVGDAEVLPSGGRIDIATALLGAYMAGAHGGGRRLFWIGWTAYFGVKAIRRTS